MFKFKKTETEKEIKERILNLCKEGDYGIIAPPMDAQVALNELCRFFLGEDWYTTVAINQEQINTEIVYEIEMKYRNQVRRK